MDGDGRPAFAKVDWAWEKTLAILTGQSGIEETPEGLIVPKNYAAANAIYQRLLRRHAPKEYEKDRVEREAEKVRARSVDPATLAHINEHKRAELLEMDIGGWYLTRAGLASHDEQVTQMMTFVTQFLRVMPREGIKFSPNLHLGDDPRSYPGLVPNRVLVAPFFCWEVERVETTDLKVTRKVTHEIARYLVRDCADAGPWMAEQMRRSLDLLDEAILDVEHEMPTVGGVEVPQSVLDHRATKEFLRHERAAIETAIHAIAVRR